MPKLPADKQEYFYEFLVKTVSLDDLEQWIYTDSVIEDYLTPDDYLELISLNFKAYGSSHEVTKILERYIDLGVYETWKLYRLLDQVINKEGNVPFAIAKFYDLYCHGYYFLQKLGLVYGLSIEVPPNIFKSDNWDALPGKEQKQLIDSMYPDIVDECEKILNLLDQKKVVLTGETLVGLNRKGFIDNRSDKGEPE